MKGSYKKASKVALINNSKTTLNKKASKFQFKQSAFEDNNLTFHMLRDQKLGGMMKALNSDV